MVPWFSADEALAADSPRIRGDGPRQNRCCDVPACILPVFAGMVLTRQSDEPTPVDSPRIRGDGPPAPAPAQPAPAFSPYSRGWSALRPVEEAFSVFSPYSRGWSLR